MRSSALRGERPLALLLWLEAAGLLGLAWTQSAPWLVPAAGLAAFFGGLGRGLPVGLAAGLLAVGAWWGHFAWRGGLSPVPLGFGVGALLLGGLFSFLGIYCFGDSTPASRRAAVLASLTRLVSILHFGAAGVLLAAASLGGGWHWGLAGTLAGLTLLLGGETALRLASRLYTPRRLWDQLPEPGAFSFYRRLGPSWRAGLADPPPPDAAFHLPIADMWMWPSVRRALPALAGSALLLTWLATAVHTVPPDALGVRQTLGQLGAHALAPGMHGSLPWPFGGIVSVDAGRVREVVLGFQSDPGDAILWERAHYVNEQMSLVGGGDDFLSISVPVLYRVGNPAQFLRSAAAPEDLLRTEAARLLLQLTLGRPAGEVMTTARESLRHALQTGLQRALDAHACGLVIVAVYLRDIHPPVTVAPAFQEVVGAIEEREAFIHEGEAYRRDHLARARGAARAQGFDAQSAATARLLQAEGQVNRFLARLDAWREAPALYQWRESFRAFDESLAGAKKVILDDRLRGALPAQIDLRRVMNPDFVDRAPAQPDTLVPPPDRPREAIDLDIDGYLRMDRGEIPAVTPGPANPDNLLAPTPAPAAPRP